MAWQDIAIPMLRVVINDLEDTSLYGNDRLSQVMIVGASYIKQEINFDTTYTVNVISQTISPDPSNDTVFMNFLILKSACIIDVGQLRTKAMIAGLVAKCGPVAIDTLQHLTGFKELLSSGPCAAYVVLKEQWTFGNAQICRAILSPFVGDVFDPQALSYQSQNYYGGFR